jgi:YegS/Rv2252/BmrU family lipid kinase
MNKDLPLIIVNPRSAGGLTETGWASHAAIIRREFGPFECAFTKTIWDAAQIAEDEARSGRKFIIAMGGDGTISEVANGILRSGFDAELGILPRGTGGDFRRSFDIPSRLEKAAGRLKEARTHRMDVGKVSYQNHQGNEETRFFTNTASFGISGEVAGRVNQTAMKWLGGKIAFASASLRTVLDFECPDVLMQVDDQDIVRLRIVIVCIANGRYFGGGMKIAPNAKMDDSLFDVVTVGQLPLSEFLMKSYRIYNGTHLELKEVAMAHAKKMKAVPASENQAILLEIDGETPGRLPATFDMIPAALRVRS